MVAVNLLRFDHLNNQRSPNYFELLGLTEQFKLDEQDLQQRWKARAAQVHPDRFVSASAAEKRIAMQWCAEVNEAYRTLKDPIARARYLCEINGYSMTEHAGQDLNASFLEQQMEWREALETLQSSSAMPAQRVTELRALETEVQQARNDCIEQVANKIEACCWPQAGMALKQWMFIEKFTQEIARTMSATA